MYTTVITSVFLVLVLFEELAFFALKDIMSTAKLKHYFLFRRIIRALIFVEFAVFNFLLSLARPEYVYQLVFQILGNILALLYFFFDFFYLSQRTRVYILWMQSIVFNRTSLNKVFDVLDANSIGYKERKKIEQQEFSIVDAGKDKGTCILIPTREGGLLLKPIKYMDEETMMFYAQKIEMDIEKNANLKFYKGDLPSEAIKSYDYGSDSKIYLWIKNKLLSKKGKNIMTWIFMGLLLVCIVIIAILHGIFKIDIIDDWLSKKL